MATASSRCSLCVDQIRAARSVGVLAGSSPHGTCHLLCVTLFLAPHSSLHPKGLLTSSPGHVSRGARGGSFYQSRTLEATQMPPRSGMGRWTAAAKHHTAVREEPQLNHQRKN